ncbi:MAG TPA: class I SAM-dependent methyltransferase [Nitrosopumilaceae archaeon]|nr:class I SAM-dependent methyltransferase [Nitrosopumilaceae archaeon]
MGKVKTSNNGKKSEKTTMFQKMHEHFMQVAPKYRELRTTDLGPIMFIANDLREMESIVAADVGCGAGRYTLKFLQHLGEKCHMYCIDSNLNMLRHLKEHLTRNNIVNFLPIKSDSHKIPLPTDSLDCIMTLNAIHHFSLQPFLKEASRVLKNNGKLFIYTRLRDQNARTIWGMHFPDFHKKEKRLYELDHLKSMFERDPNLNLDSIKIFEHHRVFPLERLIEQARNHHYSTFKFYRKKEFNEALHRFKENILHHFDDPRKIGWKDENILLVIDNFQGGSFKQRK